MNTLAAFIRERRDGIIAEWASQAAELPSAHTLTSPALRDHVPDILDRLADAIDRRDETTSALDGLPEQHAALRFQEGYDLRQVVAEYRLLRTVVSEMYRQQGDVSDESRPKLKPLTVMHEAVDHAIADAVDQYAAERDREREIFIAVLGHDLRDPLNTILFSATRLWERGEQLDPVVLKTAARIATSARRMERLVRDLLDLARARLGGGFVVQPTAFDARPLIAHTVQEISDAYPERQLRCFAESAEGNFDVWWDADRIAQVVTNLVSNALVHGGDPIVVYADDAGENVSVIVRNAGEVPPDMLRRMFNPFEAHDRRTGLGLGLFIVKRIADAHGGTVRVESSDGHTAVTVTLPRRAAVTQPVV